MIPDDMLWTSLPIPALVLAPDDRIVEAEYRVVRNRDEPLLR